MLCYAFINQHKYAHFKRRQRNIKLCLLFIPFGQLFFSTAFHFYILSNMASIVLYKSLTMNNEKFQKNIGLCTNKEKYNLSNMEKMSNLYIEWNKENFTNDTIGTFTNAFIKNPIKGTNVGDNIDVVLDKTDKLYIPTIPNRDYFRNIEDEIEYFDDEYDDFIERIEIRHHQRYLKNHREELLLEQHETLLLDDEEEQRLLNGYNMTEKQPKLTE